MVDILALVLLHDEALVEQAMTAALEVEQTSKQHVLNCLSRLSDRADSDLVIAFNQRLDIGIIHGVVLCGDSGFFDEIIEDHQHGGLRPKKAINTIYC